jgi:threonine dehydrogenase-like Zn-dependent dehydrogenase
MRAVRSTDHGPRVVNIEEPTGERGLVMEVAAASICGTDVRFMAKGPFDWTFGHEFAGTVGGVPYAVEPMISCGICQPCLAGRTNQCSIQQGSLGLFADGGLADRVIVGEANLIPLPAGLDLMDASLVEPGAVAWHAVQRAKIQSGERVAVVGGGSIGLLVVAAARSQGIHADLSARHPHQQEAAERLGAGVVSGEYDVVIDAAGSESGLYSCGQMARPEGRVVILGVYDNLIPVSVAQTSQKELTWIGSMGYGRCGGVREVEAVAKMLAGNAEIAHTLITHRFSLDDAREAFRVADDRQSGVIKIVLHP